MRRRDLEHVIRAAADLADDDEIVVIGSQAILGQYPDAPAELCVSTVRNANTRGATGWCLEAHDLVLWKYVAAREKDRVFAKAALAAGLVTVDVLRARLESMPIEAAARDRIRQMIAVNAKAR